MFQNSTLDVCALEAVLLEDLDPQEVNSGKTAAEQELARTTVQARHPSHTLHQERDQIFFTDVFGTTSFQPFTVKVW